MAYMSQHFFIFESLFLKEKSLSTCWYFFMILDTQFQFEGNLGGMNFKTEFSARGCLNGDRDLRIFLESSSPRILARGAPTW